MKKVELVLYKYSELSDKAKDRAMNEHIDFIIEMLESFPHWGKEFKDEINEAERRGTPWFLGQIIYENKKDMLKKELDDMGERFFENGSMFTK